MDVITSGTPRFWVANVARVVAGFILIQLAIVSIIVISSMGSAI